MFNLANKKNSDHANLAHGPKHQIYHLSKNLAHYLSLANDTIWQFDGSAHPLGMGEGGQWAAEHLIWRTFQTNNLALKRNWQIRQNIPSGTVVQPAALASQSAGHLSPARNRMFNLERFLNWNAAT